VSGIHVSDVVVRRLPLYYRQLETLERAGVNRISSKELGQQMGLTASQIRQDINFFGTFGQQGYGYNVSDLKKHLGEILGLDKDYNMAVVGVGNIGHAIVNYQSFQVRGFKIAGLFDKSDALVGSQVNGITVLHVDHLEEFLSSNAVDIGVICTTRDSAQKIADIMVKSGIKAIWNFAPVSIVVPADVAINHVHLTDSLLVLSYKLKHSTEE
jgi:redox-sensing transcriptional repressor